MARDGGTQTLLTSAVLDDTAKNYQTAARQMVWGLLGIATHAALVVSAYMSPLCSLFRIVTLFKIKVQFRSRRPSQSVA